MAPFLSHPLRSGGDRGDRLEYLSQPQIKPAFASDARSGAGRMLAGLSLCFSLQRQQQPFTQSLQSDGALDSVFTKMNYYNTGFIGGFCTTCG